MHEPGTQTLSILVSNEKLPSRGECFVPVGNSAAVVGSWHCSACSPAADGGEGRGTVGGSVPASIAAVVAQTDWPAGRQRPLVIAHLSS